MAGEDTDPKSNTSTASVPIVFLPSTGDAAIDCSASEGSGVRFIVAASDDADAGRLAGDADHDVDAFKSFVPKLKVDALPAEVLAVQVTRLKATQFYFYFLLFDPV
ncbi:hypothetical protein TRIUR3_26583 [Triticum urartu]|uniref:Uncharacterized protein n=1 Tax=Triticum urartu TaxID=4572 RepID=M7Z7G2_TRIUA|nr:hypothetical protein TRIUR3_26583 [Triticum urartu]